MIKDFDHNNLLTNDNLFDKYTQARKIIKQYNKSYPSANDFIIDKYGTYLDQSDYTDRTGYGIIIRTKYTNKYSFEQLQQFAESVLNVYSSNPFKINVVRKEEYFSKSVEVIYLNSIVNIGD